MVHVTVACVLRASKEYGPAHVGWLVRQFKAFHPTLRFVCFSDVDVPCARIPLKHEWSCARNRGWWAKFEIFRPDVLGDILFLDLDTVLLGSLDPLLRVGCTVALRDFNREGESLQSSVMYLTEADRARVWNGWTTRPEAWMDQAGGRGDQWVLEQVIGRTALRWQDILPGHFVSYKNDIRKPGLSVPPPSAQVVVFHGSPRPWEVTAAWIPPLAPNKD